MVKKRKTKDIRAEAFFSGTQNVNQADALREIEADFEKASAEVSLRATDNIKQLEAETEIAGLRQAEAEERWQRMNALTGGRLPEFTKPALAVAVAFALIVAEGLLMAPVMDGLNITIWWAQWMVATVMVMAPSGFLKWAVHSFRQTPRRLWQVIAPAAFSLITLTVFGWWRGEEVIFAGMQSGDGNTFAAENAFLTRLLMTLVTIALPTVAAVALEFGLEQLRFWQEHRSARNDFFKFGQKLATKRKTLEAAKEKRDRELEKVAQECASWLAAARDAFEQGQEIGAHKKPLWRVLFSIAVVAILTFVGVMILGFVFVDRPLAQFIASDVLRFVLFLLTVLGVTGLFALHALRKWNRPTPQELFAEHVTHWRNAAHPDAVRVNEKPPQLLPARADEELWPGTQS